MNKLFETLVLKLHEHIVETVPTVVFEDENGSRVSPCPVCYLLRSLTYGAAFGAVFTALVLKISGVL